MNYKVLKCGNCGTQNATGSCDKCGQYFVITESHINGQRRRFDSAPISAFAAAEIELCDFCSAQQLDQNPMEIVEAGMRQATCAACHTEILSQYGLLKREAF
jgi:predicted ATP-dependent serine protease